MRKQRKTNRRCTALRWFAVLLAVLVFLTATDIYCITPEQAVRRACREYDVAECEIVGEQNFWLGEEQKHVFILQNGEMTCMTFDYFSLFRGWGCSLLHVLEYGSQTTTVPVDILTDEDWLWEDDMYRKYVLGIIRDPDVETVELLSNYNADTYLPVVTLSQEDWFQGPCYDCFFYAFDPVALTGGGLSIRALDKDGNAITWTDLDGNQIEWYTERWPENAFENGTRWMWSGKRP